MSLSASNGSMNANINIELKLSSSNQVYTAAFLGGPLAGGWLLSQNLKFVGNLKQGNFVLFGTFVVLLTITIASLALPTDFSSYIIPVIIAILYKVLYESIFEPYFIQHVENNGVKVSWWKVVGISIVSSLVTLIFIIAAVFILPIQPSNNIQIGQNIIYYEGEANQHDAEKLATYFQKVGVFNENAIWDITIKFLKNNSRSFILKIAYEQSIEGTPAHEELKALAALIEEKYSNRKVEIQVQDIFGLTVLRVYNDSTAN